MTKKSYYILTRDIFESAIWSDNPHVTKLFLYLIGKARFRKTPKKLPTGLIIAHGELVTSLSKIADDNQFLDRRRLKKWSRAKVSRLLHYLENEDYIELLPDTFGTHIRVLNYSKYQNPKAYLANTTETQANTTETQVKPYNKDKNDKNDKEIIKRFICPKGEELKKNGESWIAADEWDLFVKHCKEIKKPITETRLLALLEFLKDNKKDQTQIIKNSIRGGYPSLYALNSKKGKGDKWDELKKDFCEGD